MSDVEVTVLQLKGEGHHAHHCTKCGVPLEYRNRSGLCPSCNGKKAVQQMNKRWKKKEEK